jgi:hypothetical protein
MRETYQTDIAPIVAERWAAKTSEGSNMQTAKQPTGAFRAEIARELFAQLPESERNRYQQAAKDEGAEARRTYDENLKNTPSRTPEDCQKCVYCPIDTKSGALTDNRCIDEVGNFLGPLLQGILECTGLHSVVLLGGPIPKYGGELKTV